MKSPPPAHVASFRPARGPQFIATAFIALAVLIAFANSFSAPLLLDDYYSIIENPTIRQLWLPGRVLSPPMKSGTGGRPLANVSFALSYALSGDQPWGHHVVSVLAQVLTALALFGVVRRTLLQQALRDRFGRDAVPLAAAIAVLWAVHPLQTQVVTYVSQRTESLMALFYLLTLYCFIRGAGQRPRSWQMLAVVACLFGMACKEVMVTAPVMVLLYDRTFVAGSFAKAWRCRWRLYAALAGTWLLLGWLLIGVENRDVGFGLGASVFDYALTECKAVVLYLRLALWPVPLIFDRGPGLVKSVSEALPWAIVLALLLVGVIAALRRRPVLGFAAAWYFVVLAPTSSIVPVVQQPIAENRPHLALAAVVALVVIGLYARIGRWSIALFGLLAVVEMVATLNRNRDFASEVGIWSDTVAKAAGNVRAQHNLGAALEKSGQIAGAIAAFEASLAMDPNYFPAQVSLGNALSAAGRDAEAIVHYRRALQIEPRLPKARINLGVALYRTGQTKEAFEQFEWALAMDPASADGHYNYGRALLNGGRPVDAMVQLRMALALDPPLPKACNNLGLALQQTGQAQEAMEQFEHALMLDPSYPDPHMNWGNALGNLGRYAEAISQWEAALRLDPKLAVAKENIAKARRLQQEAEAKK